ALQAGAVGYLVKAAAVAELELAIRTVAQGGTYLSRSLSERVYEEQAARKENPLAALTSRQKEVLQLTAEGLTSKEVAQRLNLSYRTVEAHRAQVMERLGVHDLAGLVRFAVRVGLVNAEP